MLSNNKQTYRFSESPIWQIQRAYYEQEGLRAWDKDKVPQYITCNPRMGTAYADLIFGLLQDRANSLEPIYIVELGAGSGRLAYHVLHELTKLINYVDIKLPPFKYIMTDLAMNNVIAWRKHPALQPFITHGILDFARFDATTDEELNLVVKDECIKKGDLTQPLVIIANYFFDSIPQELIYVGDGHIFEVDVELNNIKNMEQLKPSELLKQISLEYVYRRAEEYEQSSYPYRKTIDYYREHLEDSHILFPFAGLSCLDRLNDLSHEGFVLLTADKGDHLIDYWKFAEPPQIMLHGSFSLTANYHAMAHVYSERGGLSLFTPQHYSNINVGCIISTPYASEYYQTRLAYHRSIERFGPDEFYSLKESVDANIDDMELKQLLSFWRLGGYDMEFFLQSSKQISSLLAEANDEEKLDVYEAIQTMYATYYVIEHHYSVAMEAGLLMFELDRYEECKYYLEIWINEQPNDVISTVYFCLSVCCLELEQVETAIKYLKQLIQLEPNNIEAIQLLKSLT